MPQKFIKASNPQDMTFDQLTKNYFVNKSQTHLGLICTAKDGSHIKYIRGQDLEGYSELKKEGREKEVDIKLSDLPGKINNNTMNKDKSLIRLLKVKSISYFLARTDLGDLYKVLRKDDDDYHYTLDSVPLDKETTDQLVQLL